jgi:hypothetical protein
MCFSNNLAYLNHISSRIWYGRLLSGLLPLTVCVESVSVHGCSRAMAKFYYTNQNRNRGVKSRSQIEPTARYGKDAIERTGKHGTATTPGAHRERGRPSLLHVSCSAQWPPAGTPRTEARSGQKDQDGGRTKNTVLGRGEHTPCKSPAEGDRWRGWWLRRSGAAGGDKPCSRGSEPRGRADGSGGGSMGGGGECHDAGRVMRGGGCACGLQIRCGWMEG